MADIRDAGAVRAACAGARFVFHLAAIYRFWARDPRIFYDVNVGGTLNVLDAARAAGCERLVFTSTVGVLGLGGTRPDRLPTRRATPNRAAVRSLQEIQVRRRARGARAAAEGLDLCSCCRRFRWGPATSGPRRPASSLLDFLNGRMPAFVDTAMNVAHVDDLALGHLAALERGRRAAATSSAARTCRCGRSSQTLADCTGLPMPRVQVPRGLGWRGRRLQPDRRPAAAPGAARAARGARMSREDDLRRHTRPGTRSATHRGRPRGDRESARWFADNGYVAARRRAAIRWQR